MRVDLFSTRKEKGCSRNSFGTGDRSTPVMNDGSDCSSTCVGLVCKAHELVYHSTLGWREIKTKKKKYRFGLGDVERRRARENRVLEDPPDVEEEGDV